MHYRVIAFFTAWFLIAIPSLFAAEKQITIKNKGNQTVNIAICYLYAWSSKDNVPSGYSSIALAPVREWVVEGWFSIKPGSSRTFSNSSKGTFYFAQSLNGKEGKAEGQETMHFWVHKNKAFKTTEDAKGGITIGVVFGDDPVENTSLPSKEMRWDKDDKGNYKNKVYSPKDADKKKMLEQGWKPWQFMEVPEGVSSIGINPIVAKKDTSQDAEEPKIEDTKIIDPDTFVELAGISVGDRTDGTLVEAQNMKGFTGGTWTNNDQLFWGAKAKGDYMELFVDVPGPGTYQLCAKLTRAPDFGFFLLRYGDIINRPFDLYAPNVTSTKVIPLGNFTANAPSTITVTVRVEGKNPKSKGYKFGIDTIEAVPVE